MHRDTSGYEVNFVVCDKDFFGQVVIEDYCIVQISSSIEFVDNDILCLRYLDLKWWKCEIPESLIRFMKVAIIGNAEHLKKRDMSMLVCLVRPSFGKGKIMVEHRAGGDVTKTFLERLVGEDGYVQIEE